MFNGSSDSGKANVDNQADDNWGEPIDFTIEEILDMPVMGEDSSPNGEQSKTGDCRESDTNNFNRNEISESLGGKFRCEPFCITGKDLDPIDIDDLF